MAAAVAGGLRPTNQRIKRLRRLVSSRKARSEERAFVVDGPGLVAEALAAHADATLTVEALYLGVDADEPGLVAAASAAGITVHVVAAGVLDSVLDPVSPRPVAAVVARTPATLDDLTGTGPVLFLVELRDPGNVGTLVRTAEAAGAAGVVLAGPSVDPTNPKVVRAAAGAGLRLPMVRVDDPVAALDRLAVAGRHRVATAVGGDATPHDRATLATAVIVLGNEAHGLADEVIAATDDTVTIELAGPTESLNVAAAGAVLCFEALRQRRATEPAPDRRPSHR
ncbi:MAG: TrmH family RNA methyltransferase [Acidimicrobiales bacterium]